MLILLVAALTAALSFLAIGLRRWNTGTGRLRGRLAAAAVTPSPGTVGFAELRGLPAPVERFFRATLTEGQRMVTEARFRHRGTFNPSEARPTWKPFTSDQLVVTRRPGFDWEGRIAMLPGLPVRVHDAYVAGEGILHASLLGLITVTELRDATQTAEGELMRFLAEAAWYPTVLLPSQGVRWAAVDDRSAAATLSDGHLSVTLVFTFSDDGLIVSAGTAARGRLVDGKVIPTPWQGRFWGHRRRDGMMVPDSGEVAWLLPTGPQPYWRGTLVDASYRFAP